MGALIKNEHSLCVFMMREKKEHFFFPPLGVGMDTVFVILYYFEYEARCHFYLS